MKTHIKFVLGATSPLVAACLILAGFTPPALGQEGDAGVAPTGDAGPPAPLQNDSGGRPPSDASDGGADTRVLDAGAPEAGSIDDAGGDAAVDASPHEEEGETPQAQPAPTPPVLVHEVPPTYPEQALESRKAARVVLRLATDAEGRVLGAEIVEGAGPGFDESALAAAAQLQFEPARRDGQPTPARFLYAMDFEPPPPLPPEPAPEPEQAPETAAEIETKAEAAPIDVTVEGPSEAQRLRESAQAVDVVDTTIAKRESADLGEVLARTQGVGVRRGGGLGSRTRFSLNGLTDDQIRFFLDGIPLELSGYPFGIANVPVNLIDRVEIYRGVVPVRFGADALGGAVNLVSHRDLQGRHGSLSVQAGSFDTYRLAASAQHVHEPSGLFVRAAGFFDQSENDYPVDVDVPDSTTGRPSPATVHRAHDFYRAGGGNLEVGVVDRPWADQLVLRLFGTGYDKEVPHNVVMTRPYGEVQFDERTAGASMRYQNHFRQGVSLDMVGGYTFGRIDFLDATRCVYDDWSGRCTRERPDVVGEVDGNPHDSTLWDHSGYGRVNVEWLLHPQHTLRISLAPTYTTRSGTERERSDPEDRDPLDAQRDLFTLVGGAEYQIDLLDDALSNILFVKAYYQLLKSEEHMPGNIFARRDTRSRRAGAGDSLRYRFTPWLYAKASYEYATRLPRPSEIFGDGRLTRANLELEPEVSHNVNVSLTVSDLPTRHGDYRSMLNGFMRQADQLIARFGGDQTLSFQNVFAARSVGIEAAAGWTSPGEYVAIDGNVTWQSFRNISSEGFFGNFEGDRIPNRPYLFANGQARVGGRDLASRGDALSLVWYTRYVHSFFRTWESAGERDTKPTIDAQLTHAMALTYGVQGEAVDLSFTGEVDNLMNAKVFDFFGAQRPGRSVMFKTTGQF